jgi:hypothetical protein
VGASVFYAVTDQRIFQLLQVAKEIMTTALTGSSSLLAELEGLDFGVGRSRRRRGVG